MKTNNELPANLYRNCEDFLSILYNNYPKVFKSFNEQIIKYNQNPSKTKQIFQSINELISNNEVLTRELNKLLCDDLQISHKIDTLDEKSLQTFQNKLTQCFNIINLKNPSKINQIIEHFEEATKNSDFKDPISLTEEALKNFKNILFDEPELMVEINNLLTSFLKQQKNLKKSKEKIRKTPIIKEKEEFEYEYKKPLSFPKKMLIEHDNILDPNNPKSEQNFIDITTNLMSIQNKKSFVKLVFLYTESIISLSELFSFAEKFVQNSDVLNFFKKIILARDLARKKSALFFKPSSETDPNKFERITHSYIKQPDQLHHFKSNDQIGIINRTWVSIPVGSEHYTFCLMRKNLFEESLFKSEDEKFELDSLIVTFQYGINLMEKMKNTQEKLKIWEKVKELKCIQKVFKEDFEELSNNIDDEILRFNLIEKIKGKLIELQNTKIGSKKNWKEIAEKNFYKSLDHKLFYFKRQEKMLSVSSKFLKDVEERSILLHKSEDSLNEDEKQLKIKYLESLNSFEGITINSQCEHNLNIEWNELLLNKYKNLPVLTLEISNKKVLEEMFSCLWFGLNHSHFTNNERDKIKKFIKKIIHNFIEISFSIPDHEELKLYEESKIEEILNNLDVYPLNNNLISTEILESHQKLHHLTDSNKKSARKSSFDDIHHRKMSFLTEKPIQNFYPKLSNFTSLIYGSKNIYIFIRFLHILYERFLMVFEVCNINKKNENLDIEAKNELKLLKFALFKIILLQLIRQKIDLQKFEDYMKTLFGQNSFLTVTIEKILNLTIKACQSIISDLFCSELIDFSMENQKEYKKEGFDETFFIKQLDEMAREKKNVVIEKNIYRLTFDHARSVIFVNFFDLPSKNWESEKYEEADFYYNTNLIRTINYNRMSPEGLPVYLKKNKKEDAINSNLLKSNLLEYEFSANSYQLISIKTKGEDYMFKTLKQNYDFNNDLIKSIKTQNWLNLTFSDIAVETDVPINNDF